MFLKSWGKQEREGIVALFNSRGVLPGRDSSSLPGRGGSRTEGLECFGSSCRGVMTGQFSVCVSKYGDARDVSEPSSQLQARG